MVLDSLEHDKQGSAKQVLEMGGGGASRRGEIAIATCKKKTLLFPLCRINEC